MISDCNNNERVVFTVKEIQNILGIGKNSAYELVNSKNFPVRYIGNKKIIPKEPFLDWLNSGSDNFKVS